jgi:hypothetical protein
MIGALREGTGTFTAGLLFLAGMLVLGAVVALVFGAIQRAHAPRVIARRRG